MKDKVEQAIFDGVKVSYEDNYSFTGEISSIVKPEALIHINIAKQIKKINDEYHDWGRPLKIILEETTVKFATSCVPFEANPFDIFSSELRDNHNSSRNGNIDIALYTEGDSTFGDKPYAAIEVKDFITTRGELRQDIIRNLEYLTLKDNKTGNSRLEQTYLICVHEHKGALVASDKIREIDKLRIGYEKYLNKFDLAQKGLKERIVIKTVAEYLIDENDKYLPTEFLEDKAAQAIHFIGVLLIFEKQ